MTVIRALLGARYIGVRELREHLSKRLKGDKTIVVTEHGAPTKVIFPYKDVLELIEVLDELQDRGALENVREGRKAIKRGVTGIPVSNLFKRVQTLRK